MLLAHRGSLRGFRGARRVRRMSAGSAQDFYERGCRKFARTLSCYRPPSTRSPSPSTNVVLALFLPPPHQSLHPSSPACSITASQTSSAGTAAEEEWKERSVEERAEKKEEGVWGG